MPSELVCCRSCGRDCTGDYCRLCIRRGSSLPRQCRSTAVLEIPEDRYDEESGPDDVYPEFGYDAR